MTERAMHAGNVDLDACQYIHTGMTRPERVYHEIQLRGESGFDWKHIYMYPSQVKLTDYHSLVSEIFHAATPSNKVYHQH